MNVTVKPCPFCGAVPDVVVIGSPYLVCRGEDCVHPYVCKQELDEAVSVWNRRYESDYGLTYQVDVREIHR